jgi:hypothetical protein
MRYLVTAGKHVNDIRAIARQPFITTIEGLLEVVFSVESAPRLYRRISGRSTVALRVVEGEEKGTQCLGVSLGHPVLGGHKYGDLALQVGGLSNLRQ